MMQTREARNGAVDRGMEHARQAGALREWRRLPGSTDTDPYWAAEPVSATVRMPHTMNLAQAEIFLAGVAAGLTVYQEGTLPCSSPTPS
jgi:hypothetical protein